MERRGAPVSEEAVVAFERKLGVVLPGDYRRFLLAANGGRTEESACRFRVGKDETTLNALFSLDDPQPSRDLETRRTAAHDLPAEAIPVGYDGIGGCIALVVSGPHRGEIWYLDRADPRPEGSNPRVEWFDRRDVVKLTDSFREFMDSLKPLAL